jgi:hypothetical protein
MRMLNLVWFPDIHIRDYVLANILCSSLKMFRPIYSAHNSNLFVWLICLMFFYFKCLWLGRFFLVDFFCKDLIVLCRAIFVLTAYEGRSGSSLQWWDRWTAYSLYPISLYRSSVYWPRLSNSCPYPLQITDPPCSKLFHKISPSTLVSLHPQIHSSTINLCWIKLVAFRFPTQMVWIFQFPCYDW